MVNITAVIPARNEEQTIATVVRTIKMSPLINQVMVISDGSSDATARLSREAGATVYEWEHSHGKGEAMIHALQFTDAPIIAFFDADLLGLTTQHIEQLVAPVLTGERILNVGLRDRGIFVTALTFHLPLISGERVLQRSVIDGVPPPLCHGYTIESALNYYCRSRRLAYGAVKLPGLRIRKKYQKVNFMRAVLQYIRMFAQIAKTILLVRIARLLGKF
jgi:glycosyltransferase involved in cell wall biosynthesis